jgi:hypothetical protein
MSNIVGVINNAFTWSLNGELDLSAAAAVVAVRGDNYTATKTGTGTYTIVVKNSGALQLVHLLNREANFTGATLPATALGVTLTTVTQSATTGDITITLLTTALPTSGAATDGTAAVTISFGVIIRIGQLNSPI